MQRPLPGILAGTAATAATLALAVLLQSGPVRAGPGPGVFNIAIFHATGNGSADDAVEQATKANPMLSTPGGYVGATTYTGPFNFNLTTSAPTRWGRSCRAAARFIPRSKGRAMRSALGHLPP